MRKNNGLLVIICLLFNLTSCKDCEDYSEPVSQIYFWGNQYQLAKGIDKENYENMDLEYGGYPLAINSDTTTYLFYDSVSVETLSFCYNRHFQYESDACGFTVTLDSFKLLGISTFDSVTFRIEENTNQYPEGLEKNTYIIEIFN